MNIAKLLTNLLYSIPTLLSILQHYQEITKKESFAPDDIEKAKAYLATLKWKPWDEID